MTQLIDVTVPTHQAGKAPDHEAVGAKLDELLTQYFMGKKVVIRCFGSHDHPNRSLDKMTDIVMKTGTDKYDPARMGVGYKDFAEKGVQVDFYGEDVQISNDTHVIGQALWGP